MSLPAPAQLDDHTRMELNDSTTEQPAASAAAALVALTHAALPQPAAAAAAGQWTISSGCPTLSRLKTVLIDAPMYCALLSVGAPRVCAGLKQRMDSANKPACELCGRRLSKVKNTRAHGVGRACHPRCKQRPEEADAAAVINVAAEPRPSKKRRAASDPGEPLNLTRLRIRASPIDTSPPPPKKARSVIPADVSSLLDQAHERRLALLAAEANGSAASAAPAASVGSAASSATVDDDTAALTPAQQFRRDYLLDVAPRCSRCNFPRTGKKGWNEKKGCHTDKDCNENRWRTLDMFC